MSTMPTAEQEFIGREWAVSRSMAELDSVRSALLVIGQPGSGKTAMTREMYRRLSADAADHVVVAHECHANDDATLLPWKLIDLIVAALSARSREYSRAVADMLLPNTNISGQAYVEQAVQSQVSGIVINSIEAGLESPRSVFTRLVRTPLESIDRPSGLIILVDGLDETNSPDLGDEFGNFLRHTVTSLRNSHLDVRFCLSCRAGEHQPYAQIASAILNLDSDEPSSSNDMAEYCAAQLAGNEDAPSTNFVQAVATKAHGNYLYAKFAIALTAGSRPTHQVDELPSGLDGLYREFLNRRVAHDLRSSRWRKQYRPLLGLIAVARAPGVAAADLAWMSQIDGVEVEDVLEDLAEFLHRDPRYNSWSIFHDSFRKFLLSATDLRISARRSHSLAVERFLTAGPRVAPEYLLHNFAHHMHGAGLCTELGAYVTSPDRWREHERCAGISLGLRMSVLSTARECALALGDASAMAILLLRDIELRLDDDAEVPPSASVWEPEALVQIGNYDETIVWQLLGACHAVESADTAQGVRRLSWLAQRSNDTLHPQWQHRAALLLAHLRVVLGSDSRVLDLCRILLDDSGKAFYWRFLLERGNVPAAIEGPELDSTRRRFSLLRFGIDVAEKRHDMPAAAALAHQVSIIPRTSSLDERTVWEDVCFGAALAWIPRNNAGDIAGILSRVRQVPAMYADVLSALGRPQVAPDALHRRNGMFLLAESARTPHDLPTTLWIEFYGAVASRRDNNLTEARAKLRALRARLPKLGSRPDGHFVSDVHFDAVHHSCLQGLVFQVALESATVRDFALAEEFTGELLRFGSVDGASALVHLVTAMSQAKEEPTNVKAAFSRLYSLLANKASTFESAMNIFCMAVALRDLLGPSNEFATEAQKGLMGMIKALHQMAVGAQSQAGNQAVHALAASLARAFDKSGTLDARDSALMVAAQLNVEDDYDFLALKYLGSVDNAAPLLVLLEQLPDEQKRADLAVKARSFMSELDEVAGVQLLNNRFSLDEERLQVYAMRVRAAAHAGDVAGAVALCRGDFAPYPAATMLLDCAAALRHDGRQSPPELEGMLKKALNALGKVKRMPDALGMPQEYEAEFLRAEILARAGAAKDAIATQNAAIGHLQGSREWSVVLGVGRGDPYFGNAFHRGPAMEAENGIAEDILDADRKFASSLVEGGNQELARGIVLQMADVKEDLVEQEGPRKGGYSWLHGASEALRTAFAARAAAEAGFAEELQSILGRARDRALLAAWIARCFTEETPDTMSVWRPWRRIDLEEVSMRLAANALGRHEYSVITLAHLVMAAPSVVESVPAERWLAMLQRAGNVDDMQDPTMRDAT